jgi:hypothetical protein
MGVSPPSVLTEHFERCLRLPPPLLDTLLLPDDAQRPRRKYLDWHHEKIFVP